MPPHPPARLLAALVVLVVVLSAVLSGCGGHAHQQAKGSGSPSSSPSGSDQPALDPGYGVAKVGQCFAMTAVQARASVAARARVSCKRPHTSVVAYVGYVATALTPLTSVAERRAVGKKVCQPAFRALVGGTLADRAQSLLTWTLFTPGQAQLRGGARWVRCDVLARSGDSLVPLPSTSPILAGGVPENLRVCQTKAGVDVSCAGAHFFRVVGVFEAPGAAYPGVTAAVARGRCYALTHSLGGFFQPPSREGWDSGDRFVRCLTAPQPSASPTPTP